MSTPPTVLATLFSCYQPIESYLKLLAQAQQLPPRLTLSAIDTFLLRQMLAYYSSKPVVLDLAADATSGASSVLWASQSVIVDAVIPRLRWTRSAPEWRSFFAEALQTLGLPVASGYTDAELDLTGDWKGILKLPTLPSPIIVCWGVVDEAELDITNSLDAIYRFQPQAVVCALPIGLIGQSGLLPRLINYCAQHELQIRAWREISPFLGQSQLGVIYPSDNVEMPAILERTRQLFDGNFQFLSLARHAINGMLYESAIRLDATGQMRLPESLAAAQREIEFMRRSKAWRLALAYWQFRSTVRHLFGLE